ncbi:MAG: signal peptide peptidase SppA [Deltaproteobacteria bacterium]|nr:signal peptide peptidase SppA [Deltaproteobacteria bacterium]
MKKWAKRLGFLFLILLALVGLSHIFGGPTSPFGTALGVLEINGTIWVADDWLEQIEDFRKNPAIRGVVVRINSPGGTVAASQEIFENLKRLSKIKPVVASMGTLAASGGLYVALGANRIFADAGTITGSIGVRMQHLDIGELLKFFKIEYETIKSGTFKDLGSLTRPLTASELAILEGLMSEIHDQFKVAVSEQRGLKMNVVDQIADGRIFSGAKAKELGLVDELGDLGIAIAWVATQAGIKGEPELVYGEKRSAWWMRSLFGSAKALLSGPQICYSYP